MKMGDIQLVTCHKLPHRSFFFRGRQFPVCARCTGMYLGYITFPFFMFDIIHLSLVITLILLVPTFIDGLTQAYCSRESNNTLRLITGIMSGVGQMSLVAIIGKSMGFFIINHFL
ncbi:MAG: DUF2085 domain-containing protein [Ignavibacteria bacterium]